MPSKRKKPSPSDSYDRAKNFNGQRYTGMAVGRTHNWHYDRGSWKEKKMTPEQWEFTYSVTKRRVGHAPEGSGVPVGTGYHWFILAHQFVEKLNADDYSTQMVGLKLKLAHKRADKSQWNASTTSQRNHLIKALQAIIETLQQEPEQLSPVPLDFTYRGKAYIGTAVPVLSTCAQGFCNTLDVTLNGEHWGVLRHDGKGWKLPKVAQGLTRCIGEHILDWYAQAQPKRLAKAA